MDSRTVQESDGILTARVREYGDQQAFDLLVHRHQSAVRRFLLHQTVGNSQLADDLAQETFIKAFLHIGSFRGQSSFQTWLMRIACNTFYDHARSAAVLADRTLTMAADTAAVHAAGSSRADNYALRADIRAALAVLHTDERTCVTLQMVDGYDIASIAAITGMPEGTVKSHLSRGKQKLVTFLKNNGYE